MLSPARQLELLESFTRSDAWTEFLQPSFKDMSDALFAQAKAETDPNKLGRILGQAQGIDIMLQLPQLKEMLEYQIKESATTAD